MKIRTLTTLALVCAALAADAASYKEVGTWIDGSTNTTTVAGTNAIVSYVPLASTNFFLLGNQAATGAGTNLYPAFHCVPANNIDPVRNVTMQAIATGTNAGVVTFRFAASSDQVHWHSNYFWFAMTLNGTGLAVGNPVYAITNCDTYSMPFLDLQSIECPNGYATNLFLQPVIKPRF